jgi:hypothetical protein
MRTHTFLVSSSRQWNPGDEFILRGVRYLLEAQLGPNINWVLWNRNPDLFVNRWQDSRLRPDFLTNSAVEPTLDVMDAVVLAGTPEWFGPSVERVYRELLRHPDVPFLALGIGGCGPGFYFAAHEREVFNRENSLIICRNPVLAQEINEQLGSEKAIVLPCPAFLSAPGFNERSSSDFEAALPTILVQGDTVENQSTSPAYVAWLKNRFFTPQNSDNQYRFVAHYIDEFLLFSRLNPNKQIFYSYEPLDYLNFFATSARNLVASRLHGAIAALSCGTPAVLAEVESNRLSDAAKPFGNLLPSLEFEAALDWSTHADTRQLAESSSKIMQLKQKTWNEYQKLLNPFVTKWIKK